MARGDEYSASCLLPPAFSLQPKVAKPTRSSVFAAGDSRLSATRRAT
ncbi:MAG: hypothetical protein F6K58_03320 [Symploca sp. SIO2E9]|nr:hypothetical protein [Symploca sp. SIO2E9]